jgi:hypothetical protein
MSTAFQGQAYEEQLHTDGHWRVVKRASTTCGRHFKNGHISPSQMVAFDQLVELEATPEELRSGRASVLNELYAHQRMRPNETILLPQEIAPVRGILEDISQGRLSGGEQSDTSGSKPLAAIGNESANPPRPGETRITSDDLIKRFGKTDAGGNLDYDFDTAEAQITGLVRDALQQGRTVAIDVKGKHRSIVGVTDLGLQDTDGKNWGPTSLVMNLPGERSELRIGKKGSATQAPPANTPMLPPPIPPAPQRRWRSSARLSARACHKARPSVVGSCLFSSSSSGPST